MTGPRRQHRPERTSVVTRRPRLALTSLALASSLALAGCGASEVTEVGQTAPREAAAVVGDRTITVGDVQVATKGTNEFIKEQGGQQSIGPRDVLSTLMFAPEIVQTARDAGVQVPSGRAVERVLDQIGIENAPATVEFIQAQSVREQMTPQQLQQAASSVKGSISVNPRYGQFTPEQGLTEAAPNWLEKTEVGGQGLPEGHGPGDGHNH